jgi:hypothetical protein
MLFFTFDFCLTAACSAGDLPSNEHLGLRSISFTYIKRIMHVEVARASAPGRMVHSDALSLSALLLLSSFADTCEDKHARWGWCTTYKHVIIQEGKQVGRTYTSPLHYLLCATKWKRQFELQGNSGWRAGAEQREVGRARKFQGGGLRTSRA